MVRVVQVGNAWVPYQQWVEQQRAAEERQRRMPSSEGETYDTSQRRPASQKEDFDFSFRVAQSQKSSYDFTQ
jgi:hypothetical protein